MNDDRLVVAKAFNTVNRRLQIGEVVAPSDIVGDQMPAGERRKRGFLTGYDTKAADAAARKAQSADAPLLSDAPEPQPAPSEDAPAAEPEEMVQPEIKRPSRRA